MATREENALRARAYRARKKAEAAAPGTVTPAPPEIGPEVQVKAAEPTPKLTLKERFMQRLQGQQSAQPAPAKPKARTKKGKANTNLLTSLIPTLLATMTATYTQSLLPADYKQCAPSKEEASAILGPLMDIVGRRVEVLGEASQDAIDVITSLTCVMMYGTRAYITYIDIKKEKEQPGYAEAQREAYRANLEREAREIREYNATFNEPANVANGLRAYQAAPVGRSGDSHSSASSATAVAPAQNDVEREQPDTEDGDTEGRSREVAAVADLFRRDRGGRVRLGLLPG